MQPFKYNPPKLHSGQFRHKITFQKEIVTIDEYGIHRKELVEFATVWAAIKTVKGSEYYYAAQTGHENTYRFIVRYRSDLHPSMKIKYKDRSFDIESLLNDDEANKTITIIAKERV